MPDPHTLLRETQRASSDIFVFGAVIGILESGSQPSHHHDAAKGRIIKLCQAEIHRALKRMDKSGGALEAAAQNR